MKKAIVVGMPDKYLNKLISVIEKNPNCKGVKKMYTSFQFFKEYVRGEADVIFLDTSVPDKDIRLFAEKIREIDKTTLIVGVSLKKDPIMTRQFMEIISNSDFLLKTDNNEISINNLLRSKVGIADSSFDLNKRPLKGDEKKILVVDDFENTLNIIQYTLEQAGFNVTTAISGREALQKLNKSLKPDIIITDLNMPEMDGFELIEAIHKLSFLKGIPVFILTTEFNMQKKIRAKELRITGWIQKPYNITEFVKIIKKALK